MKKSILFILFLGIFLSACNSNNAQNADKKIKEEASEQGINIDPSEKTGTFNFDGKEVTGKMENQYFGDKEKGNFSVLCQYEEGGDPMNANFALLQITFLNEKDATTNPSLKIYDGNMLPMTDPEPGAVVISLSGVGLNLGNKQFNGTDKSTGRISVNNRTLILHEVVLYNSDGEKRTINAKLPF